MKPPAAAAKQVVTKVKEVNSGSAINRTTVKAEPS